LSGGEVQTIKVGVRAQEQSKAKAKGGCCEGRSRLLSPGWNPEQDRQTLELTKKTPQQQAKLPNDEARAWGWIQK